MSFREVNDDILKEIWEYRDQKKIKNIWFILMRLQIKF